MAKPDPFTARQRHRLWDFAYHGNLRAYDRIVSEDVGDEGMVMFSREEAKALWDSVLADSVIRSQQCDINDDLRERMDKIQALLPTPLD